VQKIGLQQTRHETGGNPAMALSRRKFVQASFAGTALCAVSSQSVSAALPEAVLNATGPAEAMRAMLGNSEIASDERVKIGAPDRAENGDVVPVSITADLNDVQRITLMAEKNPVPIIASFRLAPEVEGFVATRVKLAETGNVTAFVESGGKLYSGSKAVHVVIGGCGGEGEVG